MELDITKLKGPKRGEYYDLYVVLDIFSRYVVAWCVAPSESGRARQRTDRRRRRPPPCATGPAQRARRPGQLDDVEPGVELLAFLDIGCNHSRAHVSNDNPFSESQFKTLKYCPTFPERFGSIHDARRFCETFFTNTTITSTGTRASPSTHQRRSTTGPPLRSGPSGSRPAMPLTPPTRFGSATGDPNRRSCRRLLGSTSRPKRRTTLRS